MARTKFTNKRKHRGEKEMEQEVAATLEQNEPNVLLEEKSLEEEPVVGKDTEHTQSEDNEHTQPD
ncbi:unnamed protein product [Arabis nemorensis]|uniref:Uncharacterized protein n=1 Tax=Arabis nemorensis TaxID=586526 RepID=A0A565B9V8_9BRAS|nr:unnamed protein product [Arabis nemorensis]